MQMTTFLMKIRTFFTKRKIIWTIVILLLLFILWFLFGRGANTNNIQTGVVKLQDIQKTVLATGQVVSSTDLDLSLQSSGMISKVYVKEGDVAHAGQLLAEEDTSDLVSQLHNAEAGLTIAKQQASTAKSNLENVTAEQNTLVANAKNTLLNSTPMALVIGDNNGYDAPTVSGTYTCDQEGTYDLKTYYSTSGISVSYTGLEQGSFLLTDVPRPMGKCGLFLSFDKTKSLQAGIEYNVNIPNKNAPNYNANQNAYQLALTTKEQTINGAQAVLDQANASLTALVTAARPEDVATAQAQMDNAEGTVQIARAAYENTIITAPNDGTIVSVAITPGQIATANAPAIEFISN
jgi:HlyD family secretion protein